MSALTQEELKCIIEGAIMAADQPLTIEQISKLFAPEQVPATNELQDALAQLIADYENRGVVLKEVASGYRFQVKESLAPWIQKLWQERPAKYSRALLETLALIIYKQPITRAEIEEIRGVAVSTTLIKTLMEREWIRIVGHKELPGKPAIYATTKQFLDDFNLKSLSQLPSLTQLSDLESLGETLAVQLQLPVSEQEETKEELTFEECEIEEKND